MCSFGTCKFPTVVLAVAFFAVTPLCADSSRFPAPANTPHGSELWSMFSGGELVVGQADYVAAGVTANPLAKNDGRGGLGLVLASGTDREIGGTYEILLDLHNMSAAHIPSSVFNSLQGEEAYPFWGPNEKGSSAPLAWDQTSAGLSLTNAAPYSQSMLPSAGSGAVLLGGLSVTPAPIGTPEPNSGLLLALGLEAVVGIASLAKK